MGEPTDADVIGASLAAPAQFGDIFDRHATVLHRYLIRRVGADEAESMVGEIFRIAFEKRATFDGTRASARPWLYGIATNLVARRQRAEARRLRATARLATVRVAQGDFADEVSASVDAGDLWGRVADALTTLPVGERDALLLHAWEGLGYDDVAAAVDVPIGTVRSRLNRARGRLRELTGVSGEEHDDNLNRARRLRPDRIEPADPGDPAVYANEKERFMSTIEQAYTDSGDLVTPDIYPRLAYNDEHAAIDYLTRVFQFVEQREARMEQGDHCLAWLRIGSGIVMLGHANADVHLIHSPLEAGLTTVIMHVYVHDIDQHHAHAVTEGADITMDLEDAFYGERRYEATDLEGHRWHFAERFAEILARGGREPERPDPPDC